MEAAFELGSGISTDTLNLLFRSLFAGLVTLWAAWAIYRQFQIYVADDNLKFGEFGKNAIQILALLTALILFVVII